MWPYPGHHGSYCEECLNELNKTELKRNVHRGTSPALCDECTMGRIPDDWDEEFLDQLKGV